MCIATVTSSGLQLVVSSHVNVIFDRLSIYPSMEQAPAVMHFLPSMEHVQEVEVAAGLAGW